MKDYIFRGTLAELDPEVNHLNQYEAERQYRRLILIPSESSTPLAVRESLSGPFHNIYAEGYPPESSHGMAEADILDYSARLGAYRRFSDQRYYKGVEYANVVESLARRRAAEAYAANGLTPEDLFVNVQALSGGPANNAVYHALVKPGDTVMGMDLIYGGHLSHGSPVNRSGKYYNIISYAVNHETGRIDYQEIRDLAKEHKPKMIIGGFSSYPWIVDWQAFREIADEVGAYLLADISHVSGLVVAGEYPSPVGIADVVTTTTHKTLCGPRGALIMTHKRLLANRLDRAVFPGEQGGPHVNVFAALATALKLAKTDQFKELQKQIVKNCVALTNQLSDRGFLIPFGGTETHLTNLDCKSVKSPDGSKLSGDMAARILDIAGIVVNRNTIPGDKSALNPSGIRLGTPWITQRGFKEKETIQLADLIADILLACIPYQAGTSGKKNLRAKVDFNTLNTSREKVSILAESAGIDYKPNNTGYPHFPHRDKVPDDVLEWAIFEIQGEKAAQFANYVFSSDVESLKGGDKPQSQPTSIQTTKGEIKGTLAFGKNREYFLRIPAKQANLVGIWLRDMSDGYIRFEEDLQRRIPGPIFIKSAGHGIGPSAKVPDPKSHMGASSPFKPYYIGQPPPNPDPSTPALPEFSWKPTGSDELRQTPLYNTHVEMGAKMVPFGGWDMPVWYTSVREEHNAVRETAGLFDVTHMGVYQAEGPDACAFLDSVCGNDISALNVGESCYTHFLDIHANVIDDLLVYRRGPEKYMIVVNAANDDKDWSWLNAVKNGEVCVDLERPWARAFGRHVNLRNLRDPKEGPEQRVDIALQGPRSRDVLLALENNPEVHKQIRKLKRTELTEVTLGGINLVVSRTGYTGEQMAFELFVHPNQAVSLWDALMKAGTRFGLKPIGLGARDSLRTEAGLPLYGHEMGGRLNLGVGEAGFSMYVKTHKPWFIGRTAFIAREQKRPGEVARFTFNETGIRVAHLGDPVIDKRGRTIGVVTSCAIDKDGFLTGQAFVDLKYAAAGTPVYIFQSAPTTPGKAPAELQPGDRTAIPSAATIVRRFPKL